MDSELFEKGVQMIRTADPANEWLEDLGGEYTQAKGVYLKMAADQLGLDLYDPPPVEVPPVQEKKEPQADTEQEKKTYRSINELMGERARLSNQFHIAVTDAERKSISKRIQQIQHELKINFRHVQFYRATGTNARSPKQSTPEDTKYELSRKLHSIRTIISRDRRKLKTETNPKIRKELEENIKAKLIEKLNYEQKFAHL